MSSSITQKDLIRFFAKSQVGERQYTPRFDVPAPPQKDEETQSVHESGEDLAVCGILDAGSPGARADERYEIIHGEKFELQAVGTLEELLAGE